MTTHSYSAVLDNTTDAGFRAWGSGLDAGLTTAGLVQTADTGQINWVTATRPGVNFTFAGYTIWRLANSSMYFKLQYGIANGNTLPLLQVQVGTGSNGSGTLTGQLSTATSVNTGNVAATSTAIAYTTYISVLSGTGTAEGLTCVVAMNGANTSSTPVFAFFAHRSVDSSGNVTTSGFKLVSQSGSSTTGWIGQDVRTAATAFTGTQGQDSLGFAVGSPTSGVLNNGDNQVWLHWSDFKDGMQPHIGTCGYVAAEWAEVTTKSITLFGSTAHTYLAIGLSAGGATAGALNRGTNTYGLAVIYE